MSHSIDRPFVPKLLLFGTLAAALTLAATPAVAQDAEKEDEFGLVIDMSISKDVYETNEMVRAELMFANTSPEWVDLPKAATLAESLRLKDDAGNEYEPKDPETFAAAKTDELGPGGFLGFTFDVGMLFPDVTKPGRYELAFARKGLPEGSVSFAMLPLVDPAKSYTLVLETTFGPLNVELDQKQAPRAVHDVIQLARLGFYDGAPIPFVQPTFGAVVAAPVERRHRMAPLERSTSMLLAGTVMVEPRIEEGRPVNYPNLIFLLAPQPGRQGQATAIGKVVGGEEVLAKMGRARTSGAGGSPPWRPVETQGIKKATIVESEPVALPGME